MARISGIDLPKDKRVEIGLTYIYGIGRVTSNKILAAVKVSPDTRVKDLAEDDVNRIRDYISKNIVTEGDLRKKVSLDIKGLVEIGCYRGVRHRKHLPCRGQSTHSNARTLKGDRRKGTAGHKPAPKK